MLKKVFRAGEFVLVYLSMLAAALLPLRMGRWVGKLLGRLFFRLWPRRRKIALQNIREARERGTLSASKAPERLARESFENLGASFFELARIYFGFGEKILQDVSFRGIDNFDRIKGSGRGVILITAHSGNWELLALKCSRVLGRMGVVARPLDNPYMNRVLERVRAKFGNDVIYKKGALRPLLKTLNQGGIAGILMDQAVLRDEGMIIDFLGRGAWTTRMPVLLARRTGAALVPLFIKRKGNGHEIAIEPEVPASGTNEEVLRRLNSVIGSHIAENPSEWLWIHRRWKRVPEEKRQNEDNLPRALAG